jgi:probable HAF family extracellular repeat protein
MPSPNVSQTRFTFVTGARIMFRSHALQSLARWNPFRSSLRLSYRDPLCAPHLQVETLESRCLLSYTVTDLGTLGGSFGAEAFAINNRGQVVGYSWTAGNAAIHPFLYGGGKMTDLGDFGGGFGEALAINNSGQVTGFSATPQLFSVHAFLYSDGVLTDLGTFGGPRSKGQAINDRGQVVGFAGTPGDAQFHAFIYSKGTMTDIGTLGGSDSDAFGINNRGQIVGDSTTAQDTNDYPFRYSHGTMAALFQPPGFFNIAFAINNAGQVVGTANTPDGFFHAFLWSKGVVTDLGTLGGSFSEADAINASGEIIGFATTAGDNAVDPFVYSNGVMTDLMTLLPPGSGITNLTVHGINDRGQIVGLGFDSNGNGHAVLLTPSEGDSVPEAIIVEPAGLTSPGVSLSVAAMPSRPVVKNVVSQSPDTKAASQLPTIAPATAHSATSMAQNMIDRIFGNDWWSWRFVAFEGRQ